MANQATAQNNQIGTSPEQLSSVIAKTHSRRSTLRKGIFTVTSALMFLFVFNSCTKEHLEVIGKLPILGGQQETWYNLKVTYNDESGKSTTGYLGPIGSNASTSFYDYMRVDGARSKFKLVPTSDGWAYWQVDDSNWLSLKATGWVYRSLEANRIQWKIINGKLYNNYWSTDWQNYPLGALRQRILVPDAYYAGVGLAADKTFTCELVAAQ